VNGRWGESRERALVSEIGRRWCEGEKRLVGGLRAGCERSVGTVFQLPNPHSCQQAIQIEDCLRIA
jgi:hypothetical protein